MSRTFLVTGGAGFIGSHLTEELLGRGEAVVVLDDLSTGSLANLAAVIEHPQLEVVVGSILDPALVDSTVARVDTIVHLAAAVGVKLIVERPLESFLTNIRGTENVLAAAHRWSRPVLLASTSEIYGKNNGDGLLETSDRILGATSVARWSYSTSKAADEVLALAYHKEHGLPTVIARFFNTVGPRQTGSYGMVLPTFVGQALRGEPLTVHGDGSQRRCFCHVVDVVDAVLRLVDTPAAVGEVFNIGRAEEIAIGALATKVIERSGSSSPVHLVPYEVAYEADFEDIDRRVPITAKLTELTGWQSTQSLDEILDDTIAHMRTELLAGPVTEGAVA